MLYSNDNGFQQQLANLQNSIAQLGKSYQPPAPVVPAQSDDPNGVDGIDGAHAYLDQMPWNTKRTVWDNNVDCFYLLRKDANGKALPIMIGDFTLRQEPAMEDKYVTRTDFNALVQKIEKFMAQKGEVSDG